MQYFCSCLKHPLLHQPQEGPEHTSPEMKLSAREAKDRSTPNLIVKGPNIKLTIPLRHQWGLSHPMPLGIRD